MKKLANVFLKVGKIINILCLIGFVLAFVITLIVGVAGLASVIADGGTEDDIAAAAVGIASSFTFLIFVVLSIISLIFNSIASKGLRNATCKADATKPAVFAIIAGALLSGFPVASGIMMLIMGDNYYSDGNVVNQEQQ